MRRVEYLVPGEWQDDEDDVVHVAPTMPVQRQRTLPATFVPALPERRQPEPMPAWLTERQPTTVADVWQPTNGTHERTSAMDRAQALQTRLRPFLVAWAGVGGVLFAAVWLVGGTWPVGGLLGVLAFALLTAITYYRLNRTDYEYSREGSEQLRIVTAADLERDRMTNEHELRKMALAAYLATLDRHEGGRR